MATVLILALIVAARHAGASPHPKSYSPSNADCTSYDIPLSVAVKGVNWLAPQWTDTEGLMDFVTLSTTRTTANITTAPVGGELDINGDYIISSTFCTPKTSNEKSGNVLLLTHGLGYDSRYWNSAYQPETYNFAQYAISQGYSVFMYDRLGTGKSSKVGGFFNQGIIQTDILTQLTKAIRAGKYTGSISAPKKIVYVGHSYGSSISHATIAQSPDIADGVVLTGLAFAQDFATATEGLTPRVANLQDKKWKGLDAGYLTAADIWGHINAFFKYKSYTLETAEYADSIKQPLGIAELYSIAALSTNATAFSGPVLIQNGEYDFLVCNGYCPGVNEEPAKSFFSGSRQFNATIVLNTGHGLTYHTTAPESYKAMFKWLGEVGL